ncbi:MAG: VCBS repeat-containing protein [Candidatus Latescibacteria bacterium]|nr:VCBS repeat-containing protein [Candidatus Latescibacterota bacterium]
MPIALWICVLAASPLAAAITFTDQALAAGVGVVSEANGAAFGDYDGDGWPDLIVTRLGQGEGPLLFHNHGDGTFTDQSRLLTDAAGPALGAAWVDIDADGDLDLYLIRFRDAHLLFRNEGGRFARTEKPPALADHQASTSAAFGDFDGDGDLDLFATHRAAQANQFYTHLYGEGFADQSELLSPLRSGQDSFSVTAFDSDNDGDLDLFVANLRYPNLFYRNQGQGTFRQEALAAGLGRSGASLAGLPADFDNDGDLDLYLLTGSGEHTVLYRNEGQGRFTDRTAASGAGLNGVGSGGGWADFDNDGDQDLLVSSLGQPAVYENLGDGRFALSPALPAGAAWNTAGVTLADYDQDGDVDAFMAGIDQAGVLLRNDSPDQGHWLEVRLRAAGRSALGARVRVHTAAGRQLREYAAASLLGSQHGDLLHFGLGAQAAATAVEVRWPGGNTTALAQVRGGRVLVIEESPPDRDLAIRRVLQPDLAPRWAPLVPEVEVENRGRQSSAGLLRARFRFGAEEVYTEEAPVPSLAPGERRVLRLPGWQPARSGTHCFDFSLEGGDEVAEDDTWERCHHLYPFAEVGAATGADDAGKGWAGAFSDYDADGDLDLFVANGGSLGEGESALYRNEGGGRFANHTLASGVADSGNGSGLVLADFDGDGFQDLFLAKGGFAPQGESSRFFHNRGNGTFEDRSAASGLDALQSSYAGVAGDYDQDGILDLYVSRFRGQFNSLYHNEGNGRFADLTREKNIVSYFRASGGSAAFADYDEDGDVDLYASIYGDYDLFYANQGDATFVPSQVGDERSAVGMAPGDYDADGDLDVYVVNVDGRSGLYRNELESQSFVDVAAQAGVENLAQGTGCAFGDYDADGDLDLFATNGFSPGRVYMNYGDGTFTDQARAYGMDAATRARGVMLGDYDADGDLDVYVVNEGSPNFLYRNGGSESHWLQVAVEGVESNRDGIGTRLFAYAGSRRYTGEVNGTAGMSHSSRAVHLGLGQTRQLDSLVVRWTNGQVDTYPGVVADGLLRLVEGQQLTAVEETLPAPVFSLAPNYPNPFNPVTAIEFSLAAAAPVKLVVYNSLGQPVRQLLDQTLEAGGHRLRWDGRDDRGRAQASGTYFCRLRAGGQEQVRSMLLLK